MNHTVSDSGERRFLINIDKKTAIVNLQFFGVIELADFEQAFSATVNHSDFETNMAGCYDLRCALVDIDFKETESMSQFAQDLRDKRGNSYRLAFVYADEMTKMLAEFYKLFLSRTQVDVLITDDIDQATSWLKSITPF